MVIFSRRKITMTVRPPYMFQKVETVPHLLELFKEDRISLDGLLDALVHRVNWEYRGITGDNDWSGVNTWATVWEACRKGTISHEEYLYLASEYEVKISEGAK